MVSMKSKEVELACVPFIHKWLDPWRMKNAIVDLLEQVEPTYPLYQWIQIYK